MDKRRAWGVAALFCWLIALGMVLIPVTISSGDPTGSGDTQCAPVFEDALSGGDSQCADRSRARAHRLALWLVLTAPVTILYVVSAAAPRDE